jgi:uncharacterized protein YkwD
MAGGEAIKAAPAHVLMVLVLAACAPTGGRAPRLAPVDQIHPTEPWTEVKRQVLDGVNRARRQAGLAPVAWDRVLEHTGDEFCRRLVAEGGTGHVVADGVPPYLRYVLAGGDGFHRQNVGSLDSTGSVDPADLSEIALELLASMLGEQPPDDGHRETILDPLATHLGVGVAVGDGSVRISHEFAGRRATEWRPPPVVARPLTLVRLDGAVSEPLEVAAVEVLWQPLPAERPADASPVRVYGYPPSRAVFAAPVHSHAGSRAGDVETLSTGGRGRFTFSWRTGPEDGVELVIVWAGPRRSGARLTPVGLAATVVTGDGRLPPTLAAWAALR